MTWRFKYKKHDAAHVFAVHTHFIEDEEEGVVDCLGLISLQDVAVGAEVDGLVVVDEAFVVVVWPAGGRSSVINVFVEQFATDRIQRLLFYQFTYLFVQFLYLSHNIGVVLQDE